MAKLKTSPNKPSAEEFLQAVQHPQRKADSLVLVELMQEITGEPPAMWGPSIVGFGSYHYKYESGREGDFFLAGFSPRKTSLSIYNMSGFEGHEELLGKLGKHKRGKSCLYVNKLSDIDLNILKEMIVKSVETVKKRYT